jgi:hypothetical protein
MVLVRPARLILVTALAAGTAGLTAHLTREKVSASRTRGGATAAAPARSGGALPPASAGAPAAGTQVPSAMPAPDVRLPDSVDPPADPHARPSFVYGALDNESCMRELSKRGIAFTIARDAAAPGVESALRLAGPVHGVTFLGIGLAKQKGGSIFEIADCRLALALHDFAAVLARRGIVRVEHFCMHRPAKVAKAAPAKPAALPKGKAPKTKPVPKKTPPPAAPAVSKPSQHELGLAIDVGAFVKADGTRLEVKRDWAGALGALPCQPVANEAIAAAELRAIVCEARSKGLFTVILTPNANAAHADHLHLDVTRNATWTLIE